VLGRQLNALAAFTPGEIPGTHFQRLSRPQGTWYIFSNTDFSNFNQPYKYRYYKQGTSAFVDLE